MEMVNLPRVKFEQIIIELKTLRNSKLYRRLLEFESNVSTGEKFSRKGLGF